MVWGRTIRSVFGKPITGLLVKLVNIITSEVISLPESTIAGFYRNFVSNGEYDLYVSNQKINLFSPITIFTSQSTGAEPGGGYGELPYGQGEYGAG